MTAGGQTNRSGPARAKARVDCYPDDGRYPPACSGESRELWRRVLSWGCLLLAIAAVVLGWRFLPGAGGVAGEVRWLLARDRVPAEYFNRAAGMIGLAEQRHPGRRAQVFCELLRDRDPRVVQASVTLLADQLAFTPGGQRLPVDLRAAVLRDQGVRAALRAAGCTGSKQTEAVQQLMRDLFGPDWRTACEGSGATSQPSAGDGGG